MCDILDSFSKYLPTEVSTRYLEVKGNAYSYDDTKMFQLLMFGDQITVVQARSVAMLQDPQQSRKDALKGYVPVISRMAHKILLIRDKLHVF